MECQSNVLNLLTVKTTNRMISLTGVFILIDFSGVFIVKFEKILHIVLIFLLLTLNN